MGLFKQTLLIGILGIFLTGCSEFALLASGSSLAVSQNTYAKMYNAVDLGVVITTKKGIKKHAYENAKKALEEAKKGKKYIYDKTWGLTSN